MRRMARFAACTTLFTVVSVVGAAADDTARPATSGVLVLAAASLTDAFKAMGAEFEKSRPGMTVQFSFASSSTLVQQISEGAPGDVFASAEEANMQKAADAGELAGPARIFATNSLVIAVPAGNPKHIASLADLTKGGLSLALAAPTVPAGKYAAQVFANAGLPLPPASQEVDVRAVLNKVALDEADAGIVYVTDIKAASGKVEAVPIAPKDNVVARYPIATLKHAANANGAAAFADFVVSPAGRAILERFGFKGP